MRQRSLSAHLFCNIFLPSLLFFSISIIFLSCEKDPLNPMEIEVVGSIEDPVEEAKPITISHAADLFMGGISGIVVNENREALQGATIQIGNHEIYTDINGYFQFRDIELDAYGTVVSANSPNHWSLTKMVVPSKEQNNQIQIILQQDSEQRSIEASDGGLVNFNDEVKIDFPANAFALADGSDYSGQVIISASYINPADENFGLISPGDFRAFNSESELQFLVSLGMAGIELKTPNNIKLQLKDEQKATLSIRVP